LTMVPRVATCQVRCMGWVVCCDMCSTGFVLSLSLPTACAEVATFAEVHSEHETFALAIRTERTCPCNDGDHIKPSVPRLTLVEE
jgi:hypothetical protein